jgi:hypothetical protein
MNEGEVVLDGKRLGDPVFIKEVKLEKHPGERQAVTAAQLNSLPHLVFRQKFFLDEDLGELLTGSFLIKDVAQIRLIHEFKAAEELPDGLVGKEFLQFQRLIELILGYELIFEEDLAKLLFYGHGGAVFL